MISFDDTGLRRELFWDIKEDDIPKALRDSAEWVIVRVFEYGNLDEIRKVINLYGEDYVKEVLMQATLRPMARAMARLFLSINPKQVEPRPLYYK